LFSSEISDHLKYYVYRLIDPRNGETFYVGKGTDNRVFAHATDELDADKDSDELSAKLRRIREIRLAGFEVAHVIHRHGLNSKMAFEVEAALIDAYPGTSNLSGGHDSSERGAMHAEEIIENFKAETANFVHPLLAITINRTAAEKSNYEAVRYAWVLNITRAKEAEYVLAVINGLIVDAFKPLKWMEATPENFPGTDAPWPGRRGFEGTDAPEEIKKLYCRKRIPDEFRKRGAANPVRYINIE